MLLKFTGNKRLYALIPVIDGLFGNKYDRIEGQKPDQFYDSKEADDITGWQRLRNLFRKHDDDIWHPVITETIQNAVASLIVGGIYGAVIHSRTTFIKFIENNEATQFRSHLDAKRKLSDAMFASYLKGFSKWGSRVCVFVTTFTATQLALSVYQNKYAFWHYSAGGAAAGALYKFQLGPKGMISGGIFGGLFGTLYGGIKVFLLFISNQTEEDLLKFRQHLAEKKQEQDLKYDKSTHTSLVEEELKQAMMNPKDHIYTQ